MSLVSSRCRSQVPEVGPATLARVGPPEKAKPPRGRAAPSIEGVERRPAAYAGSHQHARCIVVITAAMLAARSARVKAVTGELLAGGEEVVITRHDKPVARMVPEGRSGSSMALS
jgi:hypothetical protein